MRIVRVIPVLLLKNGGVYKSEKFKNHKYIGDPINAVKIFNEKEVDEIVILDIDATGQKRAPNLEQISQIAGEAFMPVSYGGGITSIEQIKNILYEGVEKVVINYSALHNSDLITEAASQIGSSSVVVSIDVKKNWLGRLQVFEQNGKINTGLDPVQTAKRMEKAGAGEIFLNCIDRDGVYKGYDLEIIKSISAAINIPMVVCGGASSINDFKPAVDAGASAVAAGSLFVYQGPHKAVLINYPTQEELKQKLYSKIS